MSLVHYVPSSLYLVEERDQHDMFTLYLSVEQLGRAGQLLADPGHKNTGLVANEKGRIKLVVRLHSGTLMKTARATPLHIRFLSFHLFPTDVNEVCN